MNIHVNSQNVLYQERQPANLELPVSDSEIDTLEDYIL